MNYGYFDDPKKEYVITNMYPKRPWMNYLWNEQYIVDIDQFGFGTGMLCDENYTRKDLTATGDNRHIFILDRKSNEYYSATRNYTNLPFSLHETHVGQGYSLIVSEYKGIRVEFKIFVPTEGIKECWEVKVINTSADAREISVYPYAFIKTCCTGHMAYVRGDYRDQLNGIFYSEESYKPDTRYINEYFAAEQKPDAYDVTNRYFTGVYGNIRDPETLRNGGNLSCKSTCFEGENGAVMQFNMNLNAGESQTLRLVLGASVSYDEAVEESKKVLGEKQFAEILSNIAKRADEYDKKVKINTGDIEIDRRVNIWLKRQIELGKTWARVYSRGSRDTMQDITGFLPLDPKLSREKLVDAMQYVRPNGNIIRAWMPITLILAHDCSSWMITAIVQYIKETGDYTILDETAPYFQSDETGTVLDHMFRAIHFLQDNLGEKGFTLWGESDWNDSLNACGIRGKGESLWLSEATIKCGKEFAELLKRINMQDKADEILTKAEVMKKNIIKYGWDKDHFIYGYNDFGEKIGSYDSKEGQMYLNPQTWAILSDVTDEKDSNKLMDFVEHELSCSYGYVQQKPSYTKGTDHIGRVSYFQKGCYENGSVYNHGCAFKIVADCKLGRGNQALDAIEKMLPIDPDGMAVKSGVEPYAITNMYIGPENDCRAGDAVMYWISGTSGWLFRGITEFMIGVQAEYDGLAVRPVLPDKWKKVNILRSYRNASYDIDIINNMPNGKIKLTVDGKDIEGNILPIFSDGKLHKVTATVG